MASEREPPEMTPPLFIFGAGGFGREVAWLATTAGYAQDELAFVVEPGYNTPETVDGIPVRVLGVDDVPPGAECVVAVGEPHARMHAVEKCLAHGLSFARLIHPDTHRSLRVEIGLGSLICAGNILTTNVRVGEHVHLNLACTVGHDVRVGDYTTVAPGVNISGNVTFGQGVYVGTGASIINGASSEPLVIGDGAVVAAGACVTKPVEAGAMVAGVPAVRKR
jgi:sugar O-acyltransferase (sialic acid O-acetyltransferase NeuD family)